jgi:hypothetical protein
LRLFSSLSQVPFPDLLPWLCDSATEGPPLTVSILLTKFSDASILH